MGSVGEKGHLSKKILLPKRVMCSAKAFTVLYNWNKEYSHKNI